MRSQCMSGDTSIVSGVVYLDFASSAVPNNFQSGGVSKDSL